MENFVSTWYLSVFMIISFYSLNIFNIIKTKSTIEQIGTKIRSYRDLDLLKDTINTNMMLAIFITALVAIYLILLVFLVFVKGMGLGSALNHLFVFGVVCLPIGRYGKKIEKRIKTLDVEADDPKIKRTYERWLKQWSEPRFRLP